MDENIEHDHEEFENEEAPVKPLWEIRYWNAEEEREEIVHVFGCSLPCALEQSYYALQDKFENDNSFTITGIDLLPQINILNIDFATAYEDDEEDCEINPGMEEGDQGDGFYSKRCGTCQSMNLFPKGMPTFKCSKCGTTNQIEDDKKE